MVMMLMILFLLRHVQGSKMPGVSRATLAIFMQPMWDEKMEPLTGATIEDCRTESLEPGMDFGQFSDKRFEQYYAEAPHCEKVDSK